MSNFQPARTIEEVIERMTAIVQECSNKGSTEGYFAALYRDVTIEVNQKIISGYFDDNARMERLDVTFANRYLEAQHNYRLGKDISGCWKLAFDQKYSKKKIILQHLLLGMNAHINYDLAIATTEVAPGSTLPMIRNDFEKIMQILSLMLDDVQKRIDSVSPAFDLIDTFGGRKDEQVAGFMLSKARSLAWFTAEYLASHDRQQNIEYLRRHDKVISLVATKIAHPGFLLSLAMVYIRFREEKDPSKVISILAINDY